MILSRQRFVLLKISFFCFLSNPFGFAYSVEVEKKDNPNVLFISIDDLNDWIGCMKGHPQAKTPNIDRLAKRGVLFTNAHCAAPACNPSRAAVFSGRMPQVTGIWNNKSGNIINKSKSKVQFLTQAFSKAGYQTLGTGKLFHSSAKKVFDEYYSRGQRWSPFPKNAVGYTPEELPSKGTDNPRHVLKDSQGRTVVLPLNRMPSDRRPKQKSGESFDWGPFDVPDSDFGDTQITDWAIQKLHDDFDRPFFMGVGYYRPHIPLWAPKRFFDRFQKTSGELPKVLKDDLKDLSEVAIRWALEPVTAGSHATVLKFKQWQAAVEAYLACTTYIDEEIGRLLKALDGSKYKDNTLIVLWSDHGWHLGEKQHWGKWTGWERSTKVPLIIVPSNDRAQEFKGVGSECRQPVGLIDLYPSLMDLCGLKTKAALDGVSLKPLLKNPNLKTGRVVATLFDQGNVTLRSERWRYLRYADGSEELYDHRIDPHEWHNLNSKAEHRELLMKFREQANKFK